MAPTKTSRPSTEPTTSAQPCFFLKLPIELRYEIYGLALKYTIWSPRWDIQPTLEFHNRIKSKHKLGNSFRDISGENFNPNPSPFCALLSVNKQISLEVRDFAVESCEWIFRSPKPHPSNPAAFMRRHECCRAGERDFAPRIRKLTIDVSLVSDHLLISQYMSRHFREYMREKNVRNGVAEPEKYLLAEQELRGGGKADLAHVWDLTKFRPRRLEFRVEYDRKMFEILASSPAWERIFGDERMLAILRKCFPVELAPGGKASFRFC